MTWLTVCLGLFHGAGMGILLICLSIYTMDYFDKYRGTVSGLKYVGMSCSGLVFPLVLAKLVDVYGVRGTLLILGGLTMNTMPLILLFEHPAATMRCECLLIITHHVIKARDKGGSNEEEDTRIGAPGIRGRVVGTGEACVEQDSSGKICTFTCVAHKIKHRQQRKDVDAALCLRPSFVVCVLFRALHVKMQYQHAQAYALSKYVPTGRACLHPVLVMCDVVAPIRKLTVDAPRLSGGTGVKAMMMQPSKIALNLPIAGKVSPQQEEPRKSTKRERGIDANPQTSSNNEAVKAIPQKTSSLWASRFDQAPADSNARTPLIGKGNNASPTSGTSLLSEVRRLSRNPALYALLVTYMVFDSSFIVVMDSMVAYTVDKGSNLELADTLVMFAAVSGIVGRLLLPMLSDMLGLSRDVFAACNILVVALCLALLAEVSSHILVTALGMGVSMSAGTVSALKPVLVAEYVGVSLMTATLGVMGALMVPVVLTGPLLVGIFRDTMGSFDNLYRLRSAMNLFIALILFALALYKKVQGKRLAAEKK